MAVLQGSAKSVADGGFYPTEIAQSLRFNDNDSAYLSRTPSVAGNRKTWTWSGWVKRGNLGSGQSLFQADISGSSNTDALRFDSDNVLTFYLNDTNTAYLRTSQVFRDSSAWYHIVLSVDTTQATASNRFKFYVNGEQVTSFATSNYPAQNTDCSFNSTQTHCIGRNNTTLSQYLDGYLSEVHFTDGTAHDASSFGEFKNGVWIPKAFTGSYGTNGFYLDFADGGAIGNDVSGNNNDWTATNLASTDVMLDSPTNNFATLNVLDPNAPATLSQGNLRVASPTVNSWYNSTILMSSGKWYFEMLIEQQLSYSGLGVAKAFAPSGSGNYAGSNQDSWGYLSHTGSISHNALTLQTVSTASQGDILGCVFDADALEFQIYINGVAQGTAESVDSGEFGYFFAVSTRDDVVDSHSIANFGQDSSFAGNKTPQGNTDANGIGDFYYAPPTGYLALCTANLPEPAISPLNDASPSDYFNTVLYSGTGSGVSQSVTGVGFEPELLWLKSRSNTWNHYLIDAVRGAYSLISNKTNAEAATSWTRDADGFTVNGGAGNNSGDTYVAWNWKANGTPVTNTDGTITSSVSANVDSGFSIVTYAGTHAAATVGHGLNQAPDMVIVKSRTLGTGNWCVYHKDLGGTKAVFLNLTNAAQTNANIWNNTDPTSSVIHLAGSDANNGNCVAYCFHSVEGFSKIGKYTGNGSDDGTFVYTGFRPSFVMVKRTDSTSNWLIYDATRDSSNDNATNRLFPNLSNAEDTSEKYDILSNGFKNRLGTALGNVSGATYIYMAFAENPFKYSNAR